jgi:tetratricopeptide (TPR) repeat protein
MDDEIPNGVWRLDPSTRVALRLEAVRRSMRDRAFEEAMLEAEELLDESPEQADALFLLGEASLELGHPEVAADAYDDAIRLGVGGSPPLVGRALALFDLGRVAAAEESARAALAAGPGEAEAHHVLGMSLERLAGREAEAVAHLDAAQRLDPARFPKPLRLKPPDWDRALARALLRVHPDIASFWHGVPVRWEGFPDLAELCAAEPVIRPTVGGLYLGDPRDVADPWAVRPTALRLFTRNLARAPSRDALVDDLAAVLQTEALDWLGWGVEDLGEEAP